MIDYASRSEKMIVSAVLALMCLGLYAAARARFQRAQLISDR